MGFQTFEVKPGARLHYYPTSKFKDLSLAVAWRVDLDPARLTQVALVPSVLRRGTRSFPTAQLLARRCEELYGCRLATRVYKLGEQQLWWAGLDLPHPRYLADDRALAGALDLLKELLWHPLAVHGAFRSDYVEEEREVLRRALRARFNNKASWANLRCVETMCAGERYALPPLGKEEDLAGIDPSGLYRAYREVLRVGQQDVLAVGDWEGAAGGDVVGLLSPLFGEDSRQPAPLTPVEVKPARSQWQEVVERQPVNQGRLVLGLRTTITLADPLYPALLFAEGLLGRYAHSKLFVNVREKAGLAYYAHTILDAVKGIVLAVAGIDFAAYVRARDTTLEQLEALRRGEISAQEWEATYRSLRNELSGWADEAGSLMWGMMQGVTVGREFSPPALVAALERVTRDQVVEAAARLRPDTVYFLTREEAGS